MIVPDPMTTEQLMTAIDAIPDEDGWWHSANAATYKDLARTLVGHGVPAEEALGILASAYAAAADEYGS